MSGQTMVEKNAIISLIEDAISDSLGPDWTAADAAYHVMQWLQDAGVTMVPKTWIGRMTDNLTAKIAGLAAKATPGPWGIWFEQINGQADKAISELIEQVHCTDPIGNSLVMLDADGKCPAITGCGPTSADNAALIVALRNAVPDILALAAENDALKAENERLSMQLAACGIVALANTPESAAKQRQMHPDYWSASCGDVANAVDREMTLRAQLAEAVGALEEAYGSIHADEIISATLAKLKGSTDD